MSNQTNTNTEKVYDFILAFSKAHLAPPSQTEIARGTDVSSGQIEKHQRLLLNENRLEKTPRGQYRVTGYELIDKHELEANKTESEIVKEVALANIAVVMIVADWLENGELGRGKSADDILEMICVVLDRKVNPQGAVRFRTPRHITEQWRVALEWYADDDNWNVEGDKARDALALLEKP